MSLSHEPERQGTGHRGELRLVLRPVLLPLLGRSLRSAASLRRHYLAPPLLSVGLALKLGRRLDQLGQIRAPTDQERLGHRPMRHIPALEAT
jgi:hypothetical protein